MGDCRVSGECTKRRNRLEQVQTSVGNAASQPDTLRMVCIHSYIGGNVWGRHSMPPSSNHMRYINVLDVQ